MLSSGLCGDCMQVMRINEGKVHMYTNINDEWNLENCVTLKVKAKEENGDQSYLKVAVDSQESFRLYSRADNLSSKVGIL